MIPAKTIPAVLVSKAFPSIRMPFIKLAQLSVTFPDSPLIPVRKSDLGGVCPGASYGYQNNCCCRNGCCYGKCSNAPEDCIANASIPIEWVYHSGQNNYKVHRKGESMNDWSQQFSVTFLIMYMHITAEYYDINGWP